MDQQITQVRSIEQLNKITFKPAAGIANVSHAQSKADLTLLALWNAMSKSEGTLNTAPVRVLLREANRTIGLDF